MIGSFAFTVLWNGGCGVVIGISLILGGISLVNVGGLSGGFGILLMLLGAGVVFMGGCALKELKDRW